MAGHPFGESEASFPCNAHLQEAFEGKGHKGHNKGFSNQLNSDFSGMGYCSAKCKGLHLS